MSEDDLPDWAKDPLPDWAKGAPAVPKKPQRDVSFEWGRTAKQIPLGVVRGLRGLADIGAAELQVLAGPDAPKPEDYDPALSQIIGGENTPRNLPEKIASGIGASLPTTLATTPVSPAGYALGALGGIGGAVGEHAVGDDASPTKKMLAETVGSLVGQFGVAGAAKLIQNLARKFGSYGVLSHEFNVPGTKGQITGDPKQLAREQEIGYGSDGFASRILERNRNAQEEAVEAAKARIAGDVGGEATTPAEAADVLAHGLRGRAEEYRSAGDALYKRAAEKNAWAAADRFSPTISVDDALSANGIVLDQFNYPVSNQAYRIMQRLGHGTAVEHIGSAVEPLGPRVLSLRDMESAWKAINPLKASRPEDGMALKQIKQAFSDWEKRMIDNALFVGDKTAIDDIRAARPLWRRYRQMTDADPKNDYTKIISSIVSSDRTPEQVANWALNVSGVGAAGRASRFLRYVRRTFGEDSQEWQSLRQGLLYQMFNPSRAGVAAGESPGARAVASNISKILSGNGAPVARTLFSQEERERLTRFADMLRKTSPEIFNSSKSGYQMARYAWPVITGVAGIAGAEEVFRHTHDWRLAALGAAPLFFNARSINRALNAVRYHPERARSVLNPPGMVPGSAGRSFLQSVPNNVPVQPMAPDEEPHRAGGAVAVAQRRARNLGR